MTAFAHYLFYAHMFVKFVFTCMYNVHFVCTGTEEDMNKLVQDFLEGRYHPFSPDVPPPSPRRESGQTPSAPHESEQNPSTPHVSGQTPSAPHESEQTPSTPHVSGQTPSARHESEQTPSTPHVSGQTPSARHESEQTPSAPHESGQTPSARHESEQTPSARHESQKPNSPRRKQNKRRPLSCSESSKRSRLPPPKKMRKTNDQENDPKVANKGRKQKPGKDRSSGQVILAITPHGGTKYNDVSSPSVLPPSHAHSPIPPDNAYTSMTPPLLSSPSPSPSPSPPPTPPPLPPPLRFDIVPSSAPVRAQPFRHFQLSSTLLPGGSVDQQGAGQFT